MLNLCKDCGEPAFSSYHRCKPAWFCEMLPAEEYELTRLIRADSAEKAAAKLVEDWECCNLEYQTANGFQKIDVRVYSKVDWDALEVATEELEWQRSRLDDHHELDEMEPNELEVCKSDIRNLTQQIKELEAKQKIYTVEGEIVACYYAKEKIDVPV